MRAPPISRRGGDLRRVKRRQRVTPLERAIQLLDVPIGVETPRGLKLSFEARAFSGTKRVTEATCARETPARIASDGLGSGLLGRLARLDFDGFGGTCDLGGLFDGDVQHALVEMGLYGSIHRCERQGHRAIERAGAALHDVPVLFVPLAFLFFLAGDGEPVAFEADLYVPFFNAGKLGRHFNSASGLGDVYRRRFGADTQGWCRVFFCLSGLVCECRT
jgi:hypothetical protein